MLGTRSPQRDFFTAATRLAPVLEQLGFYGKLAEEGRRLFRDSDFRSCYSPIGRPSTPPSLLACARLLQHYEDISDEEVVERARFDLRWKVALDLDPISVAAPFVKSTVQAFRVRLALHAKEGLSFEKSVREARRLGLLPKKLCVALDSSPVRGRGALKDTFNLLSDAVCSVVRAIAATQGREPKEFAAEIGVERHFEPSIKGTEPVDWDNKPSVAAFLGSILKDCDQTLAAAKKAECGGDAAELLEKVIAQDVDRTDGEAPSIRDGVAKDRTISISDPEMRHGRKSTGKTYNGHKAHVGVDTDSGILTAIDLTAPNQADGSKVSDLVKQTEKLTGRPVEKAVGDTAYSSQEAVKQAEAAEAELTTKMPSPPEGKFGQRDFKVSQDRETAHCPAGHASTRHTYVKKEEEVLHYWPPELCDECPYRQQCLYSKSEDKEKNAPPPPSKGRQLHVPANFHDRRRREKKALSPVGRVLLKLRVAAEHAIGRLKNLGAGVARYFGRAKTKAQWQWTAAVANLIKIWAATATA